MYYAHSGYYEFSTKAEVGKISTPLFGMKFDPDRFEMRAYYSYTLLLKRGQDLEISLSVFLNRNQEHVGLHDSQMKDIRTLNESGQYNMKISSEEIGELGIVTISFTRMIEKMNLILLENKLTTGMSVNWTVTGQPKEAKIDEQMEKELVMPNLRQAMNFFFLWHATHDSVLPEEDSVMLIRDVQWKIMGVENYDMEINSTIQSLVLEELLYKIPPVRTLEDDLLQAKRNLSGLNVELIQQAYDFYLQLVYSPPYKCRYVNQFYWDIFHYKYN